MSLVPDWQDLKDAIAMFKWFFGHGPAAGVRPLDLLGEVRLLGGVLGHGDHRRQRPDAVRSRAATARVLPGWVFNVATIVHGEEAFLAAVFLFTVHFFNNHFRPDKFPLDIVMFTGAVPLEEFRREHALEYKRLVEAGELDEAPRRRPSRADDLGSKILGFTLIAFGLMLLVFVMNGWIRSMLAA